MSERLEEIKPLEIRGHHLKSIMMLFTDVICFDSTGKRRSIDEVIDYHILMSIGQIKSVSFSSEDWMAYRKDVLGLTYEDEKLFARKQKELLRNFLTLPDDYPVKLLINHPDDLCRACIVGAHCLKPLDDTQDLVWIKNIFSRDISSELLTLGKVKESIKTYFKREMPFLFLNK